MKDGQSEKSLKILIAYDMTDTRNIPIKEYSSSLY